MTPATRRLPLRLCPIADERLARSQDGQVVLTLKTPYRDGTIHIVMSPLEFMQRLAVLVPRPRLNLIRFHVRSRLIRGSSFSAHFLIKLTIPLERLSCN
ncbi:transposase [Nitrosomonas sp. Is37]|nr:transposase [Nitrosomonas sp. Is37]MDV6343960.1 transposase [Nitrosomonas sp. Is37]